MLLRGVGTPQYFSLLGEKRLVESPPAGGRPSRAGPQAVRRTACIVMKVVVVNSLFMFNYV